MNKLDTKISKHTNDIIQKYMSGLFKNTALEFYGIKTAKVKELINVELPIIEVGETKTDFIFLLEDNTYLHFEFQSSYNKGDMIRFANYDLRLYERDGRIVHTVVIYTSDVKKAPMGLNIGSLSYNPDMVMMYGYDGERIFKELEGKIKDDNDLSDLDVLNLTFLPLMRNNMARSTIAVNSIKLAQTIKDKAKRNTCIASIFAFASKYLNDDETMNILEVLKMTDLATLLVEDAVTDAKKEKEIEIARKALRKGYDINDIAEITGLDESTIERLQEELNKE